MMGYINKIGQKSSKGFSKVKVCWVAKEGRKWFLMPLSYPNKCTFVWPLCGSRQALGRQSHRSVILSRKNEDFFFYEHIKLKISRGMF